MKFNLLDWTDLTYVIPQWLLYDTETIYITLLNSQLYIWKADRRQQTKCQVPGQIRYWHWHRQSLSHWQWSFVHWLQFSAPCRCHWNARPICQEISSELIGQTPAFGDLMLSESDPRVAALLDKLKARELTPDEVKESLTHGSTWPTGHEQHQVARKQLAERFQVQAGVCRMSFHDSDSWSNQIPSSVLCFKFKFKLQLKKFQNI